MVSISINCSIKILYYKHSNDCFKLQYKAVRAEVEFFFQRITKPYLGKKIKTLSKLNKKIEWLDIISRKKI